MSIKPWLSDVYTAKTSVRLIINYHYWLVRPASFPAASAAARGWHEARPGVFLALWGRSRGRAAVFGESAFLRAASDIGGPLRGPLPVSLRSSGYPVRFSTSRSYRPEERGEKGGCPRARAGGRKIEYYARVCVYACDRLGAHMSDL